MSPIQEFQKEHGETYVKLITHPAVRAALFVIDEEKLNGLLILTPKEIKEQGDVILADLIGHLKHQNSLLTLHERRTFDPADLPEEDYSTGPAESDAGPADAASQQKTSKKNRTRT